MKCLRIVFLVGVAMVFVMGLLTSAQAVSTGNGAESGPRYTLNVIAQNTCKTQPLDDTNRHTIFVLANFDDGNQNGTPEINLDKTNKIFLGPVVDFDDMQVVDGNACDGDGARFLLPTNPFDCGGAINDPACTGEILTFHAYKVYFRLVGQPGGHVEITTCATSPGANGVFDEGPNSDDVIVCSVATEVVVETRQATKPVFKDYTRQLTTICLDTTVDGNLDGRCDVRLALFDPSLENFFWDWDTLNKPHAQLMFIPIPD